MALESGIEPNSLAASRKKDSYRRSVQNEVKVQRQHRNLQKDWRRARRSGDVRMMAYIDQKMAGEGVSTLGGGIPNHDQVMQIAEDRAMNRADKNAQIRETGFTPMDAGGQATEVEREAGRRMAEKGAGGDGVVGPARPEDDLPDPEDPQAGGPRPIQGQGPNPLGVGNVAQGPRPFGAEMPRNDRGRQEYIDEVKTAINDDQQFDPDLFTEKGKKFGITRDQLEAANRGDDASPNAVAARKAKQAKFDATSERLEKMLAKQHPERAKEDSLMALEKNVAERNDPSYPSKAITSTAQEESVMRDEVGMDTSPEVIEEKRKETAKAEAKTAAAPVRQGRPDRATMDVGLGSRSALQRAISTKSAAFGKLNELASGIGNLFQDEGSIQRQRDKASRVLQEQQLTSSEREDRRNQSIKKNTARSLAEQEKRILAKDVSIPDMLEGSLVGGLYQHLIDPDANIRNLQQSHKMSERASDILSKL